MLKLIEENSDYLSEEDKKLFKASIQNLRINVKEISDDDVSEIDLVKNEIRTPQLNNILEIRTKLSALSDAFKNYMTQADLAADHKIEPPLNTSNCEIEAQTSLAQLRINFPQIASTYTERVSKFGIRLL